jgi:protein TonB
MPAAQQAQSAHTVGLVPVITFVLWTGCLLVGAIGLILPYTHPHAPFSTPKPATVEKITVETDPGPQPQTTDGAQPSAQSAKPPVMPVLVATTSSASLATPWNVSEPTPIVAASQVNSAPQSNADDNKTSAQQLVFGQGEGRQPLPRYPSTARLQGQEGAVSVRINVTANGHIATVDISSASPWPLLNEAAVRTVRERWHFAAGKPRIYEVAIRFSLQK